MLILMKLKDKYKLAFTGIFLGKTRLCVGVSCRAMRLRRRRILPKNMPY